MKYGGHGVPAEPRNEHNYAFSSLLQNVYSIYFYLNYPDEEDEADGYSYSEFCTRLADELFELAIIECEETSSSSYSNMNDN